MLVNVTQQDHQTCVIALAGKINFESRHAFQHAISQNESSTLRNLILDLNEISHIDSAGLGLLAIAHKKLSPMGINLTIANPQKIVRDIILLTNMERMYPLYDSISEAARRSTTANFPHR